MTVFGLSVYLVFSLTALWSVYCENFTVTKFLQSVTVFLKSDADLGVITNCNHTVAPLDRQQSPAKQPMLLILMEPYEDLNYLH